MLAPTNSASACTTSSGRPGLRKIGAPRTLVTSSGQGLRGIACYHHFGARLLQRCPEIERNERLLLDYEDRLSCKIRAIHGFGSPHPAPKPYGQAQDFIMTLSTVALPARAEFVDAWHVYICTSSPR